MVSWRQEQLLQSGKIHENFNSIHKEPKNGNTKGEKISGKLNPVDLGTKPPPASGHHQLSHHIYGQRDYPSPNSKH